MPVVKGGVWTNIEDEILKASVSKYGLNQWARVSSLLARKTPKQCKARWSEWLDPSIRKIEWSKEEDEKLLHLAKLMPTQWRTIAPIVGRTATQCLERYQKLLDEAETRENDELGLEGPEGGENKAPSAEDVRRLRPGELDPDPESKPARPDTVDLDEDEKEMLSEARARLANTQGKKAKRKARERQLEESRRLATLQKRRELKSAGINIKFTVRKPGQMDYNADIPFEKAPALGFYDTVEEETRNERAREMFDPRKQQLASKRKSDQQDGMGEEERKKRQKNDKNGTSAEVIAAQRAAQIQKIHEAERSSKRRSLNLPAPQVSETELEDIVKMGMAGERATQSAKGDDEATRGLVTNYSNTMVGQTPIRTPRAPQEEDRIANEIRNARARTETQSALMGGDNPELYEGEGTTGYEGVAPSKQQAATPNPMATPYRQANGMPGATPTGPGATPLRTPRDSFRLNDQTPMQTPGQTPRELKLAQAVARNSLKHKLASLPKPKETDFELELPDEKPESMDVDADSREEDAAIRDAREAEIKATASRAEFKRQTQSYQRSLPLPTTLNLDQLLSNSTDDPVAREAALLMAHDGVKRGTTDVTYNSAPVIPYDTPALPQLPQHTDSDIDKARMEVALELSATPPPSAATLAQLSDSWNVEHSYSRRLLDPEDTSIPEAELAAHFSTALSRLGETATAANEVEKKLSLHLGGYQGRAKMLRGKMTEAAEALDKTKREGVLEAWSEVGEEAALRARLEEGRELCQVVGRRERFAQEDFRGVRDMLAEMSDEGKENGVINNGKARVIEGSREQSVEA